MLARFSVLKKSSASLFFSSALMKSSGSFAVLGGLYARSHLPSFFASFTSLRPAGFILPCLISVSARLVLIFDQMLFDLRGTNLPSHDLSSYGLAWPVIHP